MTEDTRRARQLLTSYGLNPKLVAVHQHNEERLAPELVAQARDVPLALVSDAGTPSFPIPVCLWFGRRLSRVSPFIDSWCFSLVSCNGGVGAGHGSHAIFGIFTA